MLFRSAGRLLGQVELVADPNVQAYVNRVGRWVASRSDRPDLPWRFGVANAGNIAAMAMPGGYILITRGMYEILDNEAELAGVLAHEIAHVVKRHHVEVIRKQNLVAAGAAVGGAALSASRAGNNSLTKDLSQAALNGFRDLFIKGLDRGSEIEADTVGVILAARAGYNAYALVDVFHKMQKSSGQSTDYLLSTHPSFADRIDNVGKVLAPHMGAVTQGKEPAITNISPEAPAPKASTGAVEGSRGFASQGGSQPAASNVAPSQPSAPSGGGNPLDALKSLKGIFGR